MMRCSSIFVIILELFCWSTCMIPSHIDHTCIGSTTTEQAGRSSGTLSFDGTSCEFTLTNVTAMKYETFREYVDAFKDEEPVKSILNIVGVRRSQSCDSMQILIASETYCIDNTVKDTLINVTDDLQVKFAVVSEQAEPLTIKYYKGKCLEKYSKHP